MNVDASLLPNSHRMGMRAIIRDYTGKVIAALSKKLSGTYSAKDMEAKAICLSLQWAKDLDCRIRCFVRS
ncbi:Ribonuclease H-like domain containing protein [Trema orientale]|uniref:Ribonuclease H-like domain containing protein n=1 Tax=Trema orientale TaxID=63057 RepID=A0A2P5DB37_TREOI|nr:Ribonuclease H-like domain containing protein [Trema orientale]